MYHFLRHTDGMYKLLEGGADEACLVDFEGSAGNCTMTMEEFLKDVEIRSVQIEPAKYDHFEHFYQFLMTLPLKRIAHLPGIKRGHVSKVLDRLKLGYVDQDREVEFQANNTEVVITGRLVLESPERTVLEPYRFVIELPEEIEVKAPAPSDTINLGDTVYIDYQGGRYSAVVIDGNNVEVELWVNGINRRLWVGHGGCRKTP